jgi:hypothetical protein
MYSDIAATWYFPVHHSRVYPIKAEAPMKLQHPTVTWYIYRPPLVDVPNTIRKRLFAGYLTIRFQARYYYHSSESYDSVLRVGRTNDFLRRRHEE